MLNEKVRANLSGGNLARLIKSKFPVLEWLPQYTVSKLLHDILSGITVGLTEIPQGIAYANVAGLPAQYGLYSGFMGCFMYFIFGTCKDINIGPTAIMALMIQPHVTALGNDMAVLIAFLSGISIFVLGLLNLGFLVQFFSYPVIAGFTSAAALNIASSQINSLMGIKGKADSFLEAFKQLFRKLDEIRRWDVTLGVCTIVFLFFFKEIRRFGTFKMRSDWSRTRNIIGIIIFMLSLARNALAVLIGILLAYCLENDEDLPFRITGKVTGGLPPFSMPPFSTEFNGKDYTFGDMIENFGTIVIFCPLIAILEHIAIAKAFSKGRSLDATQELIALGVSNIMGSFVSSMPVTGSFTRTAVNNASGVKTTLGGIITGSIVLLALSFLTSAFYYIPKATLAAVVMVAMFYLFEFEAFVLLWKSKKLDLAVFIVTLVCCLLISLEYGILIGIAANLTFVLYSSARPKISIEKIKASQGDVFVVTPNTNLHFTAAEYLRETVLRDCHNPEQPVIVDGKYVGNMDTTVAKSFHILVEEFRLRKQPIAFTNFKHSLVEICAGVDKDMPTFFRDEPFDALCEQLFGRNAEEPIDVNIQ